MPHAKNRWTVQVAVEPTATREPACRLPRDERQALVRELQALRQTLIAGASRRLSGRIDSSPSERNLAHYLAFRREDHRGLQHRLAAFGLSSLGRAEPHVLANLDRVLQLLCGADGAPAKSLAERAVDVGAGQALLQRNVAALLGPAPPGRSTHIMVTLPTEAAADASLIPALVAAGMNVARINCAHDDPEAWIAMASRVRAAAQSARRPVKVLMDLAGPKLRTGPIAPAPPVLKIKPQRDAYGAMVTPARLLLCPRGAAVAFDGAVLQLDARWLAQLQEGDAIQLVDARGRRRHWQVAASHTGGVQVQADRTAYLCPGIRLNLCRDGVPVPDTELSGLPSPPGRLLLRCGQTLRLVAQGLGRDVHADRGGKRMLPATIACTLPQVLGQLRAGERIWFDDGRIGGVIRRVAAHAVDIEITEAGPEGSKLAADKGINLPDSALHLPALTDKDLDDLTVAARHADLVGLSFVQCAEDVRMLHRRLDALCAYHLGVVLKIETRRAFEQLPELLFESMKRPVAGVMIARGDLAVECGFERLAEVQEEILWACEAAHLPVIWATQVLESMARTGRPARAEITDAAMGGRADCVMLNKGPHIVEAIRTLDDILRRMQEHQSKKRSLLRALKAWR
jgi:pyruvate kinase